MGGGSPLCFLDSERFEPQRTLQLGGDQSVQHHRSDHTTKAESSQHKREVVRMTTVTREELSWTTFFRCTLCGPDTRTVLYPTYLPAAHNFTSQTILYLKLICDSGWIDVNTKVI